VNEDFGSDFISIVDDDGTEYELELLDTLEYNNITYYALIDANQQETPAEGEDDGLIILKVLEENGEEILSTPDDDEELNMIYDMFMEKLLEDDEEQ